MMDCTDRHARMFLRGFGADIVLYTEMVTAAALLHGDAQRLLAYSDAEHPVALQLGGSEPDALARAARMGADAGYDEINLNVGCPSDRVQSGRFGACLMLEPERVADCVAAMRAAVPIPVTVKCRLGVDDQDSDAHLDHFIDTVAAAGCTLFVLHARKAILAGLSPKQNREVPPLQYHRVHAQAQRRPDLEFILNGGLTSVADSVAQLEHVDGVMLGREAYYNPGILGPLARQLLQPGQPEVTPEQALDRYLPYIEQELASGTPLIQMSRHLLGLFPGRPGARSYRRLLSEQGRQKTAGMEVVHEALARISQRNAA